MKNSPSFGNCLRCQRAVPPDDYFMLRDKVWLSIHQSSVGMMHLKCVEAELGRMLKRSDFAIGARINRMMCHLSPPLRRRYHPSKKELQKGAAEFIALLAKHDDLLLRLLMRGLAQWRAALWDEEYSLVRKYSTLPRPDRARNVFSGLEGDQLLARGRLGNARFRRTMFPASM
jgi:hypothetical protein